MMGVVPELRIYKVWPNAIGPHTAGMFEVNLFTPGIFILRKHYTLKTNDTKL
jgi:hypothetical protein